MSSSEPQHLSPNHRDTLLRLFEHPTSHNVDRRAVVSLLEAVGTADTADDGSYLVRVGDETGVLPARDGKDIDIDTVYELRHMLRNAGYGALVAEMEAKGKEA
jgi:hypothetical protein